MAPTPPTALVFDDVEIDVAGRRLLRAGTPVPLEPKAFDVLVLLVSAPGQAFGRDRILDAVWGHRHVTPGVLNRVMTLLRHALGEDAQRPRYLRTLHGVGYRFDLPPPDTAPALPETRPPDPGATEPIPPVPTRAPTPTPPTARHSRRAPGWRRTAAGVAGLAILSAAGWWALDRDPANAPATSATTPLAVAPTLIVMPLQPIGGGAADRDIAAGLSDELISALARIDGLHVIARESTGLAIAESTDISALVPRLGISHALEGSLRQSGQTLRMHLRLTDAATGRTLWAQDYDRGVADVLVLEREIAAAVAGSLALRLGLGTQTATPRGGDAEFLLRYQKVRLLLRGVTTAAMLDQAETELRELVNQRPDDARVHAELAFVLSSRGGARPQLAAGLRAEALREAATALRLDPTLPEPYHVQGTAACRDEAWNACLALHEKALAIDPSSAAARMTYAMALASMGYVDRAGTVLRAGLVKDPLNRVLPYALGRLQDTLGDHAQARATFERAAGFNLYGPWFNAVWRGDLADAMRLAERMDRNPRDPDNGPLLKTAYVAATQALADPRLWPRAIEAGREFERQTGMMDFLRVLHPQPDAAGLVDGFEKTRKRGYSTWDLLLWTRELAYIRRDPAFRDYLRRSGIVAHWRQHGAPSQCRVEDQLATCE